MKNDFVPYEGSSFIDFKRNFHLAQENTMASICGSTYTVSLIDSKLCSLSCQCSRSSGSIRFFLNYILFQPLACTEIFAYTESQSEHTNTLEQREKKNARVCIQRFMKQNFKIIPKFIKQRQRFSSMWSAHS